MLRFDGVSTSRCDVMLRIRPKTESLKKFLWFCLILWGFVVGFFPLPSSKLFCQVSYCPVVAFWWSVKCFLMEYKDGKDFTLLNVLYLSVRKSQWLKEIWHKFLSDRVCFFLHLYSFLYSASYHCATLAGWFWAKQEDICQFSNEALTLSFNAALREVMVFWSFDRRQPNVTLCDVQELGMRFLYLDTELVNFFFVSYPVKFSPGLLNTNTSWF